MREIYGTSYETQTMLMELEHTNLISIFYREHPVALNSQGIQIVNIFRIFVFDGKY
jgi:hypothetical protein